MTPGRKPGERDTPYRFIPGRGELLYVAASLYSAPSALIHYIYSLLRPGLSTRGYSNIAPVGASLP